MAQYNDVIPNGAERILEMAVKNQDHRQSLEKVAIHHELGLARLGQVLAFLMGIAGIGAGAYIASLGQTIAGTGVIGGVIATIAIAYFKTVQSRRKEREDKAKIMAARKS